LRTRSGFVTEVLNAEATLRPSSSGNEPPPGDASAEPNAQRNRPQRRRERTGVALIGAAAVDALPQGTRSNGGLAGAAILGDVVRIGNRAEAGLTLGIESSFGQWRGATVVVTAADGGLHLSGCLSTHLGLLAALLYTPSLLTAEGRFMGSWRSYRAMAGVTIDRWSFGATVQEIGRGSDDTLRAFGAYGQWRF
jgi:hypothetical protein